MAQTLPAAAPKFTLNDFPLLDLLPPTRQVLLADVPVPARMAAAGPAPH